MGKFYLFFDYFAKEKYFIIFQYFVCLEYVRKSATLKCIY